jgi:DNA mismatch repair protein MutS
MSTPMQVQYNQIKEKHPDDIVLFRLGDFYEAFYDDAATLNRILGLTLTGRGKNENRIPMAGIPYHALKTYLPELIKNNFKVVIVEQLTDPEPGKIVERDIVKIHTPGTIMDDASLAKTENNYLLSIIEEKGKFGVAFAEVSTGKFLGFETADVHELLQEISRISPAEIVLTDKPDLAARLQSFSLSKVASPALKPHESQQILLTQFGTTTLKGFGIEAKELLIAAAAQLLQYLQHTQRSRLDHLKSIAVYNFRDYMPLDEQTIRNLELVWPIQRDGVTLLQVIDNAGTAMGKRKLRNWLLHPHIKAEPIIARQQSVEYFLGNVELSRSLRERLQSVIDCERILGRIGAASANARDLVGLSACLKQLQEISQLLPNSGLPPRLQELVDDWTSSDAIAAVIELINTNILADPAIAITEGNLMRPEADLRVAELRELASGGKSELAQIQQREVNRTGISSLKVAYNQVFGYYIEITNTHKDKVPADYIRKQTLTNAERYITPELKDLEEKIISAQTQLTQLEYELFLEIRLKVAAFIPELLRAVDYLAELDVLLGFALTAREFNYSQPILTEADQLELLDGRHPVVERLRKDFTPNSIQLDANKHFVVLTGPNMSGKSTYLRQIALLVLMAQMGSFVPAKRLEFKLVDRIFTRVGASDNLSRGESTFMVEMSESANILNNATAASLIILDEVGRGTSTYDGVAIAWAICEYIVNNLQSKTIFATHYHELTALAGQFPQIVNSCVQVLENGEEILFSHKIIPGAASRSYGVHVAKLAGMPEPVVEKANEILKGFEGEKPGAKSSSSPRAPKPKKIHPEQLGLL